MELSVFCKRPTADLIPKIVECFKEWGMELEVHPEFRFDPESDAGYLPLKMQVQGEQSIYSELEKPVYAGFELLYHEDYNYEEHLQYIKDDLKESRSFVQNLFKKKEEVFVANPEIDAVLQQTNFAIDIKWSGYYTSELRASLYFALALTKLCDGVAFLPDEDEYNMYFEYKDLVEKFQQEVQDYESSMEPEDINLEEFVSWDE